MLHVTIVKDDGVDLCEGQVLAKCCVEGFCADVPVEKGIKPGVYSIEDIEKNPVLKFCIDVITRQKEMGIKKIEVCTSKHASKCVKKLVEHVISRYGGPVLLIGYNENVAKVFFSLTDGLVADTEGRLVPYDVVDISNPAQWVDKASVVVISPGALRHVDIIELTKKAKELKKPVVVYGALSPLYKDLGIDYFCPYGLRENK
ncbi:MAG: hypothetical protein QXS16_00515 [Pyrobaculum sp.]